jgi:hypothetical protein
MIVCRRSCEADVYVLCVEPYLGSVAFDASDETIYLELRIDDLDSAGWVGSTQSDTELSEASAGRGCRVKLLEAGHARRGQSASAQMRVGPSGIRFAGRSAFS